MSNQLDSDHLTVLDLPRINNFQDLKLPETWLNCYQINPHSLQSDNNIYSSQTTVTCLPVHLYPVWDVSVHLSLSLHFSHHPVIVFIKPLSTTTNVFLSVFNIIWHGLLIQENQWRNFEILHIR